MVVTEFESRFVQGDLKHETQGKRGVFAIFASAPSGSILFFLWRENCRRQTNKKPISRCFGEFGKLRSTHFA